MKSIVPSFFLLKITVITFSYPNSNILFSLYSQKGNKLFRVNYYNTGTTFAYVFLVSLFVLLSLHLTTVRKFFLFSDHTLSVIKQKGVSQNGHYKKARQIFRKKNTCYPLRCTYECVSGRNKCSFSDNLVGFVFLSHSF